MKVTARRRTGFTHEVETDTGHTIVVDEPKDMGGADQGPSPTRLGAAALAACAAITVEMYAERKGWELGDVEVEVEMDYAFQAAHAEVTLRFSSELTPEQVERLEVIAGKCPVHRALAGQVEISDRIELV